MRRLAQVLLLTLVIVLLPSAGRAEPADGGCSVLGTGLPTGVNGCRYISHGPGAYQVASASGFRITAFRTDPSTGQTKGITLAAKTPAPNRPDTGVAVQQGDLATLAGDLVDLAIQVGSVVSPTGEPLLRYQDGYIQAHDK